MLEEGEILSNNETKSPLTISQLNVDITETSQIEANVIGDYEKRINENRNAERVKYLEARLKRLLRKDTPKKRVRSRLGQVDDIKIEIDEIREELGKLENFEDKELFDSNQNVASTTTAAAVLDSGQKLHQQKSDQKDDVKKDFDGDSSRRSFFPYLSGDQIIPRSQQHLLLQHKPIRNIESPQKVGGESPHKVGIESPQKVGGESPHKVGGESILPHSKLKGFQDDSNFECYAKRILKWCDRMDRKLLIEESAVAAARHFESSDDGGESSEEKNDMREAAIFNRIQTTCTSLPQIHINDDLIMPSYLWSCLYPHQQTAISFFWELHNQKMGGLLGDEMGLGKTLSILSFLASCHFSDLLLSHDLSTQRSEQTLFNPQLVSNGILIVCPATVIRQWVVESRRWYPPFRCITLGGKNDKEKRRLAKEGAKFGNLTIVSYDCMRIDINFLSRLSWSYIILDEGQKIRNPDAGVTLAAKRFTTPHRILLSGSPVQNNLKELWSLFDFVVPGRLGTLPVFMEHFADPIRIGGLSSASREAALIAYECASTLRSVIHPHLLRRNKASVGDLIQLPPKQEQVLFCHLSPAQFQIYVEFLESNDFITSSQQPKFRKRIHHHNISTPQIFFALSVLRKICNHPDLLLLRETHIPEDYGNVLRSGKIQVALAVLKVWKKEGHRSLFFSQTIQLLNLIEPLLRQHDFKFRRLDGMVSINKRHEILQEFNDDQSIFLLLLTTRVGGVGLNLMAANRVMIFDPDWNPMTDVQARERSWRIGQTKDVLVYRLILGGTIEEKIYHRQIYKQFLSQKILEDPKQKRFFKLNDLRELFQVPPRPPNIDEKNIAGFSAQYRNLWLRALGHMRETVTSQEKDSSNAKLLWERELLLEGVVESEGASKTIGVTFPGGGGSSRNDVVKKEAPNNNTTVGESADQQSIEVRIPKRAKLASETAAAAEIEDKQLIPRKAKVKLLSSQDQPIQNLIHQDYIIRSERAGLEAFGKRDSQKILSQETNKEHNMILETLFDQNGIQSSLSHDIFELSHPDFDLAHKHSVDIARRALHAITTTPLKTDGQQHAKDSNEEESLLTVVGESPDSSSNLPSLLETLRAKANRIATPTVA